MTVKQEAVPASQVGKELNVTVCVKGELTDLVVKIAVNAKIIVLVIQRQAFVLVREAGLA